MKILLSVCGSISAYKSLDIARGLINNGHEVKVILTKGALKFVVPEVFTYLGALDVYLDSDDFRYKNVLHVDLARWSDILVIAPLSANTLSRLARGEASDLLSSVFLAYESSKPIALFPAMNSLMLKHPFTQENIKELKKLKTLENIFISPTNSGVLACNEVGQGKLPSVDEIIALVPTLRTPFNELSLKKKIVITTGATISPMDPVRYLSNSSSGITGYHLAISALKKGYNVVVIAGRNAVKDLDLLKKHPSYQLIRITTVSEMHHAVHAEIKNADAYLSAAAISDVEFDSSIHKIKKECMTDTLQIKKAIDILKTVIELQTPNLKIVGFAAETILSDDVLTKKYQSKPVDLLVATKVDNGMVSKEQLQGFNVDQATYRFVANGIISAETTIDKQNLGEIIFNHINF
ncbi:MAG: bifunctional phosphopantothenoylcysteine decarboxylase/phosphopantothenate--cysteine ligase CoaBC [Bacteriovorax sp.]|nr:bifunctional phosphopantothenoylcysteine decarboxylase/phosphopantothenate--cysteine ligase CoaBC [Bacteriovorax sp.]